MIFVETSAWFGSVISDSKHFQAASNWLRQNREPLLTTDYVVDETLTLLKARGQYRHAQALGDAFFRGELATVHYVTEAELQETWQTFRGYSDKDWSFTDCSSKVVMEKLAITQAFAFDIHFTSSERSPLCRNLY